MPETGEPNRRTRPDTGHVYTEEHIKRILKKIGKGIIRRFNFDITRRVNGRKIVVPFVNGIKVGVSSEPWLSGALIKLLPLRKGLFVDVGANLGQTLIKLKSIKPARGYVGFEPNPACVFYLRELIRRHAFENSEIIPAGLSD